MGDVAITFKVLPEGMETDIGAIRARLLVMGAKHIKEVPIAFGLKMLEVLFVVPDSKGPDLEEEIKKIKGVASVETEGVTLV